MSPTQKQLLFAADALFLDLAANASTKILLSHFSSTNELVIQHAPISCPLPQDSRLTGLNAVRSYFDLISVHWERKDLCLDSQNAITHPTKTVTVHGSVGWTWRLSRREWTEKFTCTLEYDDNLKVVGMVVETTSPPATCVMRAVDMDSKAPLAPLRARLPLDMFSSPLLPAEL